MNNQNQQPQGVKQSQNPNQKKKNGKNKKKNKGKGGNTAFASTKGSTEVVPVAYSNRRTTGKPAQTHLPNGDVIIEHEEFIADLPGSVGFSAIPFPVNPGQSQSFPWLSQIAPNYESYQFEKLVFEYQNTCGSATQGLTMLGVDYDASDAPPVDKIQFSSYQGYTRDVCWKTFNQHNSKQNLSKQKTYFVRSGAVPAGADVKLYDVGNFFAATQGMADTSSVGELYVKYRVKFMTPQIQNPLVGTSKYGKYTATAAAAPVAAAGSNAPLVVSGTNSSSVTLTATSAYSCLVSSFFSSNAVTPVVTSTGSDCTIQDPTIITSSGVQANYTAELSFLPGQKLVLNNTNVAATTLIRVGQFNTVVL